MRTVAITGGTGFIGGALVRALIAKGGYRVRILTRGIPPAQLDAADYHVISFDDPGSLANAIKGADIVVHLAARLFSRSRTGFERANVTGTANLVKAAAGLTKPPEKVVYLSSLAAGGPSPSSSVPRDENLPEAPVSDYGRTKLGGEMEIRKLPPGIRFTVLRPPIVYGKNESGVSKIAQWVRNGFMVNAGTSDGSFSFVYIDDLTSAIITAMETRVTDGKTYYICENKAHPWRSFIGMLAAAMKVRMPFMLEMPKCFLWGLGLAYEAVSLLGGAEPVFNRDKAKEGAAGPWTASSSRWERDTGQDAWTPLEEGIKRTFS